MPNHLSAETSPYLLQHRDNPVDWHPWGPEALRLAEEQQKPIFLSVGYSACHWCHVMAHESFEDERIAGLLNEHFICIKVDREERPDLDQVYMNAVQLLTGRGGWPMSVFLTPALEPFFGGTYWPPTARMGMPGFDQVIEAVAEAWRERRQQALAQGAELAAHIKEARLAGPSDDKSSGKLSGELSAGLLRQAGTTLERQFDPRHGGFGGAPKFPHPLDLQLLLRLGRQPHGKAMLEMVVKSLDMMAAGGIYDHLGGGFHRYSVDDRWLVPHFEKMLYDNALLATCYLEGFLATGRAEYAQVVGETLEYILRDMTDPAGGFYSAEDADSEGEEGKFYVWTPDEIAAVLGADASSSFNYVYDVIQSGNFEATNILNRPKTIQQCAALHGQEPAKLEADLGECRKKLLAARDGRVRPGRDDKVLVAWNGLMIDAFAQAAGAMDSPRWLAAATKAADFILTRMRADDGRLLHTWRAGHAKVPAFLDDYAALVNSLVTLYEATFDERWIEEAVRLADILLARFADPAAGGFFLTADDQPTPLGRQKEWQDSATPSGNSLAAMALLRLGKLTGSTDFLESAVATLRAATNLMDRFPTAASQMLLALDLYLGPTPEIAILGDPAEADTQAILSGLRHRFLPNKVVAMRSPAAKVKASALDPLFAGKTATELPTVFICENFTCGAPLIGKEAVLNAWNAQRLTSAKNN
jgi:uncharacterized protein YyaL (SSP411 family)